ncbi:MAG: response regulator [Verrucomicrobiota bacterium]|nr:response regulator [Limisphaera sp.]MDW8382002.1 response regulator [Verrucomicrobiota bacterium]
MSTMKMIPDAANTAPVSALPRRKPVLLIVDDEEGPRQSLQVIFKDDFEVLLASDGPTAIALAQQHPVDVAITDIRMAGMSGLEVLERLKHVNPGIEVVVITAYETTETIRQALRLQACDYINKPFDVATIRAAVQRALQRHTLEYELHHNAEHVQALRAELQNQRIAEQIAQTRGEIYASIIHDINGPLTVISGYLQMLNQRLNQVQRLEASDLEFFRERLRVITRQVTNCVEISRRYLSYLKRGGEDATSGRVQQLLGDLAQLVRVHPSAQRHEFVLHPVTEPVAVRTNGTDFIQVLMNLAVNAFQCSTEPHRVEVEGQLLTEPLDLSRFRDTPRTRFLNMEGFDNTPPLLAMRVRDNGPGMPPEVLARIFDPWFTTKDRQQGTGLGLNIVQRLVRSARGAVFVETCSGEGTTFTVYFPALMLPTEASGAG